MARMNGRIAACAVLGNIQLANKKKQDGIGEMTSAKAEDHVDDLDGSSRSLDGNGILKADLFNYSFASHR